MPTLHIENGIKVECFSGDHPPPHVHVSYGEHEDLIIINSADIYEGDLPIRKRKLAIAYVAENKEFLLRTFLFLNPQLARNENK
ncbi:DUF4160 domain-containing protein [Robiginitalea sp. SC105]|uniref:DUF4160 domain-containing protein n=1 Tax=Robiginitalea sp. SC105 TaxID=2762332 RepID=UPI00163AF17E|nr:DUF4160 domain-containing protein [Robiginitalea sp. SC105]